MDKKNLFSQISACRTAIMGAAALWVWLFHQWTPVLGTIPLISQLETFAKDIGFAGVDIFFLLSGMGLMYSRRTDGILAFYRRRALRVYLPFFLTGILVALERHWSIAAFLGNVSGFRFLTVSLYSFLWFVPAILVLYLFFPLYRKWLEGASRPGLFTAAAIGLWLVLSLAFQNTRRTDLYLFTNRIPVFLTGIFLGHLAQRRALTLSPAAAILCLGLLGLGAVLAYLTNYRQMPLLVPMAQCFLPNYLMAVSGVFLMAGLLSLPPIAFVRRGLEFFGRMSLEFYCIQEWLGAIVRQQLQGRLPVLLVNIADLLCVTLAALLLQQLCRLLTKKNR